MAKKILIAGASGLIGTRLTELLIQQGFEVSHLSRRPGSRGTPSFIWNVMEGTLDPEAFAGVDTIINLAGAGVADKRWSKSRKKEILESRIRSVDLLYRELRERNHTITGFINASAIGYYGAGIGEEWFDEASPVGKGFLADVVSRWEAETEKINSLGLRVVKLRIGIVLSNRGGALKSIVAPIKVGLGSPLGDGKQYMSWIHIDDLCSMFIWACRESKIKGVYNATGIKPAMNRDLTRAVARVLKRPLWLPPVPGFLLRLLLGEMSGIVLAGSKVSSWKIQQSRFAFRFVALEKAVENLLVNGHSNS